MNLYKLYFGRDVCSFSYSISKLYFTEETDMEKVKELFRNNLNENEFKDISKVDINEEIKIELIDGDVESKRLEKFITLQEIFPR